ncbi:hypothetical protein Lqui_1141 [Legionella quinlivanii]|uniref:Uncharacterized protein n=1 Tax=Legionella quinlivanii TaxID=45073 RepID=A0A0W0Y5T7_9GAMM|nr:hypothetical protein [Legionella quinlivanii]KTD52297.1 hypothetical protein Lqui_1141 [Legionella quinlivanii]MCW8449647.1 hypothetical protein [Legionella quinlivanii]SEF73246.1 hypothetical protein SAMN02746093_00909 [Legionella quinlivanii DSM 21216]STY12203.1 Uncharacterised protein [Legionella quinlivanii]
MNGCLLILLTAFLFPFSVTYAADDFIDRVTTTIKQCYAKQSNKEDGITLAQCISGQLEKMPNPENYIVNLEGKDPHHMTLYLYNPKGFRIICAVTANETLEINNCQAYKTKPLNSEQQLSIDPNQLQNAP